MTTISILTDNNFDDYAINSDKPVLVSFAATWSPPSQDIARVLRNIAAQRDDIEIAKIDVGGQDQTLADNDNPATRQRFNIRIFPTLLMFKNGKVIGMLIGAVNEQNLDKWIDQVKSTPADQAVAIENFPAFANDCYQKLQHAAQKQAETNFSKTLKLYRGLSLAGAFARVAGGLMLPAVIPGTASLALAAAIVAPAALKTFNILKSRNSIPVEPQPKNGVLRTAFNFASLAGGAFLAHGASLGTLSAPATIAGYALGGYIALHTIGKIVGDLKQAFSTDLSKYPVTPPDQKDRNPPAPPQL